MLHNELTLKIQFKDEQAMILVSKVRQITEFLQILGMETTVLADEATLECLERQRPHILENLFQPLPIPETIPLGLSPQSDHLSQ